jgi:O-antigen ligase/tetratricopeptide (TPR) repeat protein
MLLTAPLVFTSATLEAFETPKLAITQLGTLALLALGLIARRRPIRFREPILIAACCFVLSALVSTITSISPRTSFFGGIESLAGLTTVLSYLVLLLAARLFVTDESHVQRLLFAPVIAAGVAASYAIIQALRLDPYPWEQSSSIGGFQRPFSTLAHANSLGGYLVMALPLVVYFNSRRLGIGRALGIVTMMAVVVAIGLTLTRSAWLAFAAIVFLGAAFAITRGYRKAVAIGTAMAAAAVVIVCTAAPDVRSALQTRLAHFSDGAGRISLWKSGLSMAAAHPVFGIGLDTFAIGFGPHRDRDYWRSEWNTTPTRAHNEVVHTLATQGVVGFVALVAIAVAVIAGLRKAARQVNDSALVYCVGASLLAFCVHSLLSFAVVATGSLACVLVGIVAAMAGERHTAENSARRGIVVVGIATSVTILGWVGVIRPFLADVECRSAELASLTEPQSAIRGFESAVAQAPGCDLLWFKLSQGARAAARAAADPILRQQMNDRARSAQQAAIDLVPEHPGHRAHFARLLFELSREGAATNDDVGAAFQLALRRDPNNPTLLGEAANAATARGDRAFAQQCLSRAIELDPNQANLRALSGLLAMTAGHFEEAEEQLHSASDRDWHGDGDAHLQAMSIWAACLVRLNRAADAEVIARQVVRRHPDWPNPRFTLAYALSMLGRRDEAIAEYQNLIADFPDHSVAAEARKQIAQLGAEKHR